MKVLVTGATGFIGRGLVDAFLAQPDIHVAAGCRAPGAIEHPRLQWCIVEELGECTDWSEALNDADIVLHCAAANAVAGRNPAERQQAFWQINVAGTRQLARQAAQRGVRRFIYLSTIKVHGETGGPFTEQSPFNPQTLYASSKFEAEQALTGICDQTPMEYVIIRAPLVYGAEVTGNFRLLMRWANSRLPNLVGSIRNQRSMIYLGNLIQFVELVRSHPAAANQAYLIGDGQDLSTAQVLRELRKLYGRPPSQWGLPLPVFRLAAMVPGLKGIVSRLTSSLRLDDSKARYMLGWVPEHTTLQGFQKTVLAKESVTN